MTVKKGLYHQVYLARVAAAIQACETVADLSHSGEKGRIREILLSSLFRPLLPADLGVGTGFVVSTTGQVSSQTDIVLFDKSILPPAMFDDSVGLFPVESVLYTIEVKSTLTRAEIAGAHESAKKLASFSLQGKDSTPIAGPRPLSAILALSTDLTGTGKSEEQRYVEVRASDPPYLSSICVVGSGYWWNDNGTFRKWPENEPLAELIGFLSGIMNSIPSAFETRRALRPALGHYLVNFAPQVDALAQRVSDLQARVKACSKPEEAGALLAEVSEIEDFHAQFVAKHRHVRPDLMDAAEKTFIELARGLRRDLEQLSGS